MKDILIRADINPIKKLDRGFPVGLYKCRRCKACSQALERATVDLLGVGDQTLKLCNFSTCNTVHVIYLICKYDQTSEI